MCLRKTLGWKFWISKYFNECPIKGLYRRLRKCHIFRPELAIWLKHDFTSSIWNILHSTAYVMCFPFNTMFLLYFVSTFSHQSCVSFVFRVYKAALSSKIVDLTAHQPYLQILNPCLNKGPWSSGWFFRGIQPSDWGVSDDGCRWSLKERRMISLHWGVRVL